MSWRLIIVVLLVAAGVSAWGGVRLGDWLIANSPEKPILHNEPLLPKVPVLDANGKPTTMQPPQPLVDGHFGVPQEPQSINWDISPEQSAADAPNLNIALATTTITMDEAKLIASGQGNTSQSSNLQGIADVGSLGLGGGHVKQPLQPVDVPPPPPPPAQTSLANNNWQQQLQQALNVCAQKGFFDRPSCAWDARRQYCEPNNAWGKIKNCPARP
jgi:hypothetical protein